jgi:hypothetical protein
MTESVIESNYPIFFSFQSMLRRVERDTLDKIYIAARFERDLPPYFVLGDGQTYGGYVNKPLRQDGKFRVFVRAYTDSVGIFPNRRLHKLMPQKWNRLDYMMLRVFFFSFLYVSYESFNNLGTERR